MKKIFQGKQYLHHAAMRMKKEAHKKRIRKIWLNKIRKGLLGQKLNLKKDCIAPECFSIINNPNETLVFFDGVRRCFRKNIGVVFHLENVKEISADAILYMLSLLDNYGIKKKISISGTAPKDPVCNRIFTESGFYSYVYSRYTPKYDDKNILTIRNDVKIVGRVAAEVLAFVERKSSIPMQKYASMNIYTAILECMGNVRQHAYAEVASVRSRISHKWWLMALYDQKDGCVHFSILDNGFGIPQTLKRKLFEYVSMDSEVNLIKSALNGEFRSRTNLAYRGKGLPKIYSIYNAGLIKSLSIVSNHAFLDFSRERFFDKPQKFYGTLISWTINVGRKL